MLYSSKEKEIVYSKEFVGLLHISDTGEVTDDQ